MLEQLWASGPATAREIHDVIGEPRGLVYTTIAKVLDRLFAKRLVTRKRQGRAFSYRPSVTRESIERRQALRSVGDLLGDEPAGAIATLVDAVESIDAELLDELERIVSARRRKLRRGS